MHNLFESAELRTCTKLFQVCELPCLSMHGDKSQSERSRILESFLNGECPVLVCTALLGRGIDLPHVSQVSIKIASKEKDHCFSLKSQEK